MFCDGFGYESNNSDDISLRTYAQPNAKLQQQTDLEFLLAD